MRKEKASGAYKKNCLRALGGGKKKKGKQIATNKSLSFSQESCAPHGFQREMPPSPQLQVPGIYRGNPSLEGPQLDAYFVAAAVVVVGIAGGVVAMHRVALPSLRWCWGSGRPFDGGVRLAPTLQPALQLMNAFLMLQHHRLELLQLVHKLCQLAILWGNSYAVIKAEFTRTGTRTMFCPHKHR